MPPPLTSLKILDFSTLLPGPFASLHLADLGAEVLRVEAPNRPDLMRLTPPFDGEHSAWHSLLNRSKRSLALDLKHPAAVEIVKQLVQKYDIVLEQFRPGVMDRLGVGYAALQAANPSVIYCAITAYGQDGPYRDRAAHDLNSLALSGMMAHTGRKATGPLPLGVQVADMGSSFLAVTGILAAVIQRMQTGEGQFVDISMFDTALAWNALAASQMLVGGEEPEREGWLLNGGSYYDCYRTSDDRYLSVGGLEPKFWSGFCQAIGRPDLISQGLNAAPSAQQTLKQAIAETISARPLAEWMAIFEQVDVCVEPVLSVAEARAHPQTQARQMVVAVPKPDGTHQSQTGTPIKFSASQPIYQHIGATRGEHTAVIMQELGYSENEIAELRQSGLFG
ncbi:MAG: CaiB/BaiF CoA-transferase family protein [Caldilineaceae bacterium]